jgi:hypothetical protein
MTVRYIKTPTLNASPTLMKASPKLPHFSDPWNRSAFGHPQDSTAQPMS